MKSSGRRILTSEWDILHIVDLWLITGNAGNKLDGYNPPTKKKRNDSSSEESESDGSADEDSPLVATTTSTDTPRWQSTTPALRPISRDRFYYNLPYYEDKPCVYLKEVLEDHRRRMYNTNMIDKIAEKLVSKNKSVTF